MLSRDHVIWCYRILLGREPENEDVIADKLSRLDSVGNLRNEFFASPEFSSQESRQRRQKSCVTSKHIEWAWQIFMEEKPSRVEINGFEVNTITNIDTLINYFRQLHSKLSLKSLQLSAESRILILGNCQTDMLARLLSHKLDCQVENIRENVLIDPACHPTVFEKIDKADLVISQILSSERLGPFRTEKLSKQKNNILTIPNLYFSGLHPDLIYVGPLGQRYLSPIGDYHSAISIAAFMENFSLQKTVSLFRNPRVFEKAGFFEEWHHSLSELQWREIYCDITISEEIRSSITQRPLFYSSNHPSLELLNLLIQKILLLLKKTDIAKWTTFWRDDFQMDTIYPVWLPIAEHHQLTYRSPEIFFVPPAKGFQLELYSYLEHAFRQYAIDLPRKAADYPKIQLLRPVIAQFK